MKPPVSDSIPAGAPDSKATQAPFIPAVVPPASLLEENNRLTRELGELREQHAGELKIAQQTVKRLTAQGLELQARLEVIEQNPLVMVLANLDAGSVLDDAGEKLTRLTADVRRLQAKGKFVFSIAVKPFKGDALVFVPHIKATPPEEESAQGVFYSRDDGTLSRQDPRQRELEFSKGDRSAAGDVDPYRDEREAARHTEPAPPKRSEGEPKTTTAGSIDGPIVDTEDSDADLAAVNRLFDESMDATGQPPSVARVQRAQHWGYMKASRVLERVLAAARSSGALPS